MLVLTLGFIEILEVKFKRNIQWINYFAGQSI